MKHLHAIDLNIDRFIDAPTSRRKLNITLPMFQHILSYHQVPSLFAETVFAYGYREYSEECNTTTFHGSYSAGNIKRKLQIDELGRSGRLMEQCYGLRSVESSRAQPTWPWSIRQASIYHSLDLETAQSVWIVIKANKLIEKLARDTAASPSYSAKLQRGRISTALSAAMEIHEQIALWCGSSWQWYISFLEDQLQAVTQPALAFTTDSEPPPVMTQNTNGQPAVITPTTTSFPNGEKSGALRTLQRSASGVSRRVRSLSFGQKKSTSKAPSPSTNIYEVSRHHFTFTDLPRVHKLEEKINEALDVLRNNDEVLNSLKNDYVTVVASIELEDDHESIQQFSSMISGVQNRLRVQHVRTKQLLRLLNDRKALLQEILSYESMEANRVLAEKASISATKMEDISKKTNLETVSMRIITLVTLFFLPGTFISTLMSTPIVTFAPGSPSTSDGDISAGALSFFCAVSVPLMLATFGLWLCLYWWEARKEVYKRSRMDRSSDLER